MSCPIPSSGSLYDVLFNYFTVLDFKFDMSAFSFTSFPSCIPLKSAIFI